MAQGNSWLNWMVGPASSRGPLPELKFVLVAIEQSPISDFREDHRIVPRRAQTIRPDVDEYVGLNLRDVQLVENQQNRAATDPLF